MFDIKSEIWRFRSKRNETGIQVENFESNFFHTVLFRLFQQKQHNLHFHLIVIRTEGERWCAWSDRCPLESVVDSLLLEQYLLEQMTKLPLCVCVCACLDVCVWVRACMQPNGIGVKSPTDFRFSYDWWRRWHWRWWCGNTHTHTHTKITCFYFCSAKKKSFQNSEQQLNPCSPHISNSIKLQSV